MPFWQFSNHKHESELVTIHWVNAGEEHYSIKYKNKGKLRESLKSNAPSQPKAKPSGMCASLHLKLVVHAPKMLTEIQHAALILFQSDSESVT